MGDKDCHAIRKVTEYMDDKGRRVKVLEQVYGKDKEPDTILGAATARVQIPGPGGRPMLRDIPVVFQFQEGTSIKKAFELFDDAAKKAVDAQVEDMKKKAEEQSRIITPDQAGRATIPFGGPAQAHGGRQG